MEYTLTVCACLYLYWVAGKVTVFRLCRVFGVDRKLNVPVILLIALWPVVAVMHLPILFLPAAQDELPKASTSNDM